MSTTPALLPLSTRRHLAAAATVAAGAIHVAAAVPHFGDALALGAAFFATGVIQIITGASAVLLRGEHRTFVVSATVAVNLAALGGWLVSRTVGLPIGHGGPEPVGLPDLVTVVFEVLAVAAILWWGLRGSSRSRWTTVAAAAVLAGWALMFTGAGVATASLALNGHGHEDAAADHHDDAMASGGDSAHGHDGDDAHDATEDAQHEPLATGHPVLHVHDDDSIHVHDEDAEPHIHEDGSVHVHLDSAEAESTEEPDGGHTHAPGEEH